MKSDLTVSTDGTIPFLDVRVGKGVSSLLSAQNIINEYAYLCQNDGNGVPNMICFDFCCM